jgi:hypothetical protein
MRLRDTAACGFPSTLIGNVTSAFNGGFASVRSLPWAGWAELRRGAGVRLLVRGDGRTYKLNVKVGGRASRWGGGGIGGMTVAVSSWAPADAGGQPSPLLRRELVGVRCHRSALPLLNGSAAGRGL